MASCVAAGLACVGSRGVIHWVGTGSTRYPIPNLRTARRYFHGTQGSSRSCPLDGGAVRVSGVFRAPAAGSEESRTTAVARIAGVRRVFVARGSGDAGRGSSGTSGARGWQRGARNRGRNRGGG